MARKDKMYMPSGSGGLVRYQGSEKQKINLKPKFVVYAVVAIVAFEIVMKLVGSGLIQA